MSISEYPAQPLRAPRLARLRSSIVVARPIPADVWIVGALVVIAAVIRVVTIDNQSFWTDEALTAYEARLPFGAMINTVMHVETTPPLYFVLAWGWGHLFGTGEVALRSISALAGVGLVPIAYLSARALVSRRAGVLAAAFVAVNPYMIWYSQEARAYMLLTALSGASFLWFLRAREDPTRRALAWWAVCSSLALMTHFFAGFLVAPEALWLLWIWRTRAVASAVGLVAVAQAAMLPFAFLDTSHGAGWIAAIPRVDRFAQTSEWWLSLVYRRASVPERLLGIVVLITAVVLLLGLGGDRRTRARAKMAVAIAAFSIFAPLALGLVGQDYFLARNVLPAFVPVVTVIAAACAVPRARAFGLALAVALLTIFSVATVVVQSTPRLQRADWRNVVHALGPASVPRAVLAADGTSADPLKIYLPHVDWVQSHSRPFLIRELDVVGATKRSKLVPSFRQAAELQRVHGLMRRPYGRAVPRSIAPAGTFLLSRVKVNSWIVARFALRHPMRVSIDELAGLAGRFFRQTPAAMLIFVQQPGR